MFSLRLRLLLATSLTLAFFLVFGGLSLDRAFNASAEQSQMERMQAISYALLGGAEPNEYGELSFADDKLPDTRLQQPQSGLEAALFGDSAGLLWGSPSLSDDIPTPANQPVGEWRFERVGQRFVLVFGLSYASDGSTARQYSLMLAEDTTLYDSQMSAYRRTLLVWLGGGSAMLLLLQGAVMRWSLRPLRRLVRELGDIEAGQSERIEGAYPQELRPLTEGLNAMIVNERSQQSRYRNALGDLAHSLKTPLAVLHGIAERPLTPQNLTEQHRLLRTPPGEVVARSMDADRFARYADRWIDFGTGLVIVVVTAIAGWSLLAGGVLLAVMVGSALASTAGRPIAGRSASAASAARAGFGRSLVSALESARTVKLAAATPDVHRHLRRVDGGRVEAAVFEHRVQAVLDGVPIVMVQCGVVAAWATYFLGGWGLATALLVASAVNGFDWFGRVAGSVITEAPGTRSWQVATTTFAGGGDLMHLPDGVDLVAGTAPAPPAADRVPLRSLELRDVEAVHEDGTRGATGVDLTVEAGELVPLLGQVGSGKSSLLASLAGLVDHTGSIRWNGEEIEDAQRFLRPGQVAYVAQVPRVLSGTFSDNIALGHERPITAAIDDARLGRDVADAGGPDSVVGHRGVRLSGGQVQRLALARALAADAELLLADDVSSALDAATEVELWKALRDRGTTVLGATSKRAALAQADRVVVLVDGEVVAVGPWAELAPTWGHLAG